jgi:hypothetical protein
MTTRGKPLAPPTSFMRLVPVTLVLALVGCAYKPGSFSYSSRTFAGERVTIGCLDLSVDRRADMNGDPVLDYQFGNRCDSPVTIDLVNLRVVGRMATGEDRHLRPFDPHGEMRVAQLDALQAGGEAIAYVATEHAEYVQLCVDIAQIERTDKPRDAHWVCFGQKADLLAEASR